jgi:hypothetical protein
LSEVLPEVIAATTAPMAKNRNTEFAMKKSFTLRGELDSQEPLYFKTS